MFATESIVVVDFLGAAAVVLRTEDTKFAVTIASCPVLPGKKPISTALIKLAAARRVSRCSRGKELIGSGFLKRLPHFWRHRGEAQHAFAETLLILHRENLGISGYVSRREIVIGHLDLYVFPAA